jgi:hypothetical protein
MARAIKSGSRTDRTSEVVLSASKDGETFLLQIGNDLTAVDVEIHPITIPMPERVLQANRQMNEAAEAAGFTSTSEPPKCWKVKFERTQAVARESHGRRQLF